jgi:hypothetical protein
MIMQFSMVMTMVTVMTVVVGNGLVFVRAGRKLTGQHLQGQPAYQYTQQ